MARRKLSRSANGGRRCLRRGLAVVNHRRSISCQFLCGGDSFPNDVAYFASEFLDRSIFLRDAFHASLQVERGLFRESQRLLHAARKSKDHHDQQNQSQTAAWVIAPASAVGPGGKSAKQKQNQYDQQYCSHSISAFKVTRS